MKATLEFNLTESDDRMAHLRCIKSTDMALVLWELTMNTRKKITMGYDVTDEYYRGVNAVITRLNELTQEYNIDIEELIQ